MEIAEFINRTNFIRFLMKRHGLWTPEAIDEVLNAKDFSLKDLMIFEAAFSENISSIERGFKGYTGLF